MVSDSLFQGGVHQEEKPGGGGDGGGCPLGVPTAAGTRLSSLDGRCRVGAGGAVAALGAAQGPALRVRLMELLDGVAVALHVAVAGRGRGVDAALALLEAGWWCFGGVLRWGKRSC